MQPEQVPVYTAPRRGFASEPCVLCDSPLQHFASSTMQVEDIIECKRREENQLSSANEIPCLTNTVMQLTDDFNPIRTILFKPQNAIVGIIHDLPRAFICSFT